MILRLRRLTLFLWSCGFAEQMELISCEQMNQSARQGLALHRRVLQSTVGEIWVKPSKRLVDTLPWFHASLVPPRGQLGG